MFRLTMFTMVTATLAACGAESPQTISGRVSAGSFPEPVTRVIAIGNDGAFSASSVSTDGLFALSIPAGERYRIELQSAVRASQLVFPRATNTFFVVESGEAFDLGGVHYVRDHEGQTTIHDAAIPDHAPDDELGGGGDEGGGGGGEEGGGGGGDEGGGGGGDEGGGGGGDEGGGGGQDTGGGGGE